MGILKGDALSGGALSGGALPLAALLNDSGWTTAALWGKDLGALGSTAGDGVSVDGVATGGFTGIAPTGSLGLACGCCC